VRVPFSLCLSSGRVLTVHPAADIGNGEFEPAAGAGIAAPQPNYGATNV
jgi:hypothetical protein